MVDQNYNKADVDEQWFAFHLKTWRDLKKIIAKAKEAGVDQKDIAARAGMDPAQLNRILTGKVNVTLRTMHTIARAADHRPKVLFEPLKDLRAPNSPPMSYARIPQSAGYSASPAQTSSTTATVRPSEGATKRELVRA